VTNTLTARRVDDGSPVRVGWEGGRITSVEPVPDADAIDPHVFVAPAFFDLQVNGYGGTWFSDAALTVDDVLRTLAAYWPHGVTRLLPTVITGPLDAMCAGLAAVAAACQQEAWADQMAVGCHVEGPFISPEDGPRGAHPAEHVRPCSLRDFERLQQAAAGRVRLITLAPESPGAADFIRAVTARGVRVAIGHTAANTEQIAAAVEAGATLSTHLGNGAHGQIRRHPNYIWDQLADDRLSASVIADGHHLPANVLKTMIRAKGWGRVILTCDASGLAGSPPGVYEYHGAKFEVLAEGPIVVAGQRQYLAGSGQFTDDCVAGAVRYGKVTLAEACAMASSHPAQLLGYEGIALDVGSRADLVVFRWSPESSRLSVLMTVAAGQSVFGRD
jgi:N-acetylglucosamine-6-phosphate deacetylase